MHVNRFDADTARPFTGAVRLSLWRLAWLMIAVSSFLQVAYRPQPAPSYPGTATLINEHPYNTSGKRHPGSVCWRIDRIGTAAGRHEIVVHADVEIPDSQDQNDDGYPAQHRQIAAG